MVGSSFARSKRKSCLSYTVITSSEGRAHHSSDRISFAVTFVVGVDCVPVKRNSKAKNFDYSELLKCAENPGVLNETR